MIWFAKHSGYSKSSHCTLCMLWGRSHPAVDDYQLTKRGNPIYLQSSETPKCVFPYVLSNYLTEVDLKSVTLIIWRHDVTMSMKGNVLVLLPPLSLAELYQFGISFWARNLRSRTKFQVPECTFFWKGRFQQLHGNNYHDSTTRYKVSIIPLCQA